MYVSMHVVGYITQRGSVRLLTLTPPLATHIAKLRAVSAVSRSAGGRSSQVLCG